MKDNYLIQILFFFILKIYRIFNFYKKTSIDEYPITYTNIKNYYNPLNNKASHKQGYFLRYFSSAVKNKYFIDNFFLFKYFHFFNYEILFGKVENLINIKSKKQPFLLPITPLKNKNINLNINYLKNDKESKKKINIKKEIYTYIKIEKETNVQINSKDKLIIGNPLFLKSDKYKYKKNILLIFIDGLPSFDNNLKFEELMPNTKNFFEKGIYFNNHFSTSEWTLPSFASIFTGLYSYNHKIIDPKKEHNINNHFTISNFFKNKGYINFQIGSTARSNPAYGYYGGFDRILYKRNMYNGDVIFNFLEHNETFKNNNQFNLISFFDLHHFLNGNPSILSQSKLGLEYLNLSHKKKSIHQEFNEIKTEILKNEIKRIDLHLSSVYEQLNRNYNAEENLVILFSDHGHSYLNKDKNILSRGVTKVPLLIKDGILEKNNSDEFTSNVDLFNSIIHLSGYKIKDFNNNSNLPVSIGGNKENKFVLSESIYPNSNYHAVIRNKFYEFYFKTNKKIKLDKIDISDYNFELKDNNDKLFKNRKIEKEFLNIIHNQVKIFNS